MWKTRLRCALNKMPDIRELPDRSRLDVSEPYRVYQLLPPVHKGEFARCCRWRLRRKNLAQFGRLSAVSVFVFFKILISRHRGFPSLADSPPSSPLQPGRLRSALCRPAAATAAGGHQPKIVSVRGDVISRVVGASSGRLDARRAITWRVSPSRALVGVGLEHLEREYHFCMQPFCLIVGICNLFICNYFATSKAD